MAPESLEAAGDEALILDSVEREDAVTRTRNEILATLNKPDAFILAIVQVSNGFASKPRHVRKPFQREPDFGATPVTYKLTDQLAWAEAPT